ncbi:MAG TPA: diguanylate cyclase [Chloroflexia bacterium]|nr:diguanylate cyclase [Chloroflexia bacterium]
MTLRARTVLAISLTLAGLIGALYLASNAIVLGGFVGEEDQDTRQNVQRVVSALATESDALAGTARDWAGWDDTYAYIHDHNPTYIQSNLAANVSYINNQWSLTLYLDPAGTLVFGKAFDLGGQREVPLPAGLDRHLTSADLLVRQTDPESSTTGLLALPDRVILVSAQPILTSARQGPVRGTLILGRFFDAHEIAGLARTTQLTLTAYPVGAADMPADVRAALAALTGGPTIIVRPLSADTVGGYTLLRDIYGQPALVLRTVQPRAIYARGQSTLLFFIVILLVIGGALSLVNVLVLEAWILAPLARLSRAVATIGRNSDLTARVPERGRDELARLGQDINNMLAALEQAERALAHRAFHDSLTGLPNRALFMDRLTHALARSERALGDVAVLFLDLDDFKAINDTLGHAAGDQLLIAVAGRIQASVRGGDTVARLGGDEFTVLMEDLTDRQETQQIVARIQERLGLPFLLNGRDVTIRASLGVAWGRAGTTPADLLRRADLAMYQVKRRGKAG